MNAIRLGVGLIWHVYTYLSKEPGRHVTMLPLFGTIYDFIAREIAEHEEMHRENVFVNCDQCGMTVVLLASYIQARPASLAME
jgi:hypothetical protein